MSRASYLDDPDLVEETTQCMRVEGLAELISEARTKTIARGHYLGKFTFVEQGRTCEATAVCRDCGSNVVIRPWVATSNGCLLGNAFLNYCEEARTEGSIEWHAVRGNAVILKPAETDEASEGGDDE